MRGDTGHRCSSDIATRIRAATIRDSLEAWASATRYALRIGVPSWDVIERWGDYHFARALQRSLERAGHPTRLQFLPEWGDPVAAREDVTVHVFGLKEAPIRPGQVNLLWQISHPDLATPAMYDRYDHVFVASDAFAAPDGVPHGQPGDGLAPGDGPGALPARIPPARTTSSCSWRTRGTSGGASSTTWPARPTTSRCTAAAGCPS